MDEYILSKTLLGRIPVRDCYIPYLYSKDFLQACESAEFADAYLVSVKFASVSYVLFYVSLYSSVRIFEYIKKYYITTMTILTFYPAANFFIVNRYNGQTDFRSTEMPETSLLMDKGFSRLTSRNNKIGYAFTMKLEPSEFKR